MKEKRCNFDKAKHIGEAIETLLRLSPSILRLRKETNILLNGAL
jgi:hypothetical protein